MSKRQNIFIEATPLANQHLSGVGQVILETLRALDEDSFKDKFHIKIFAPFDEKANMERYTFKNIEKVFLPFPHKFLSLFSRLSVAPPLDVFLGRGVYIFPNFRNWNLLSSQSMTYIHDVSFEIYPQYIQPRNLVFLKKYIELWKRRTDEIITVSRSSKAEVQKYLSIPAKKITVIENTVDATFYTPQKKEIIEKVKQKYILDNYFLFIGNIEPRKNIETLIEAFRQAKLKNKTTLFIVGGDGWLNETVYAAIKSANAEGVDVRKNSTYVPDADLPALISGAQALVLPSWHEGFGLPILQAIACGTPAIGSHIPSLVEIAEDYPGTVELFEAGDARSLTSLIEKYATEKSIPRATSIKRSWRDAATELLVEVTKLAGKA